MRHYILEGREVVPAELMTWAVWFETGDRVVARTTTDKGDVSTVFLGLDHRFGIEGPPILFETLVFGGPLADEMERYSTYEQAEEGHARMVARVEAASVEPT